MSVVHTHPVDVENVDGQQLGEETLLDNMNNLVGERNDIATEIYQKKSILVEEYRTLYKPVHDFIGNQNLSEELGLRFSVSMVIENFIEEFFSHIHHGQIGNYCGKESADFEIQKILKKHDFKSIQDTLDFLSELNESLEEKYPDDLPFINYSVEAIQKNKMRTQVLSDGVRIDGRGLDDIRDIECEIGLIPRAHGSALFTRGQTQSLGVSTLGTKIDEQKIEGIDGESWKRYMLHYNFPPFSVGEVRRIMGPGRREIGHER